MGLDTPGPEDATDALVDGDRILVRGTARAALRHRDFRIVWSGTFASNIGTWMQNVLLGAYGYTLTHSATYVGLLFFAQLGPLLFLSNVGGALADVLDRRRLLLWTQWEQLIFSIVLAFLATAAHPSRGAILACVLVIGLGNALGAPALSAILPTLVPRPDLSGAVALQSVQMNLSRVIGPAIGAAIYAGTGAAPCSSSTQGRICSRSGRCSWSAIPAARRLHRRRAWSGASSKGSESRAATGSCVAFSSCWSRCPSSRWGSLGSCRRSRPPILGSRRGASTTGFSMGCSGLGRPSAR